MTEVCCRDCNRHLGWMIYSGPTGSFYCDECKEADDAETLAATTEGRE